MSSEEPWPTPAAHSPAAVPPPPGAAPPPPPPPSPMAPAPGASPAWTVPPGKPPRPAARVGAVLLLAGAVALVAGSLLTWFTIGDVDVNGFTELPRGDGEEQVRDGPVFTLFAVLLAGFGVATLAAGRMLAVAILAVVVAAFATIAGLADYGDVQDAEDLIGAGVSAGPGLPVVVVGALVALAGSIVVLAKRRRWP